jgi:cysteine desulfurase
MKPYLASEDFGNPSSFHSVGKSAKEAVDEARARLAKILNCKSGELVFTSGGTEANNLSILGIYRAYKNRGNHIVTNTIEHHSVLHAVEHLLKKEGAKATYLKVDKYGQVKLDELQASLTLETVLVSVMYANNEIGTINKIQEIGRIIQNYKSITGRKPSEPPFFHTDACQAAGACELDVSKLGVDLMTINSAKIYGPKGVGILYIRQGVRPEPLIFGGGQESGLRGGTENVPGIVGFVKALELAQAEKESENARLSELRDYIIRELLKIPKSRLNGHPVERLPNNINISFLDIEGEAMILYLDAHGVYTSTGSACTSGSLDPSHVILGIGLPYEAAHGSLRLTLGKKTTKEDIDYVLDILPGIVQKLRSISPIRVEMKHYV